MKKDFKHGTIVDISIDGDYWKSKFFYIFYCPEEKLHYVELMYDNIRTGGVRTARYVRIHDGGGKDENLE